MPDAQQTGKPRGPASSQLQATGLPLRSGQAQGCGRGHRHQHPTWEAGRGAESWTMHPGPSVRPANLPMVGSSACPRPWKQQAWPGFASQHHRTNPFISEGTQGEEHSPGHWEKQSEPGGGLSSTGGPRPGLLLGRTGGMKGTNWPLLCLEPVRS